MARLEDVVLLRRVAYDHGFDYNRHQLSDLVRVLEARRDETVRLLNLINWYLGKRSRATVSLKIESFLNGLVKLMGEETKRLSGQEKEKE